MDKQSTVREFQGERNPTIVVRARGTSKQIVTYFSGISGHVRDCFIRTIQNGQFQSISEIFEKIRETNCKRRLILHHDSARLLHIKQERF